jgi:hypothetical protein
LPVIIPKLFLFACEKLMIVIHVKITDRKYFTCRFLLFKLL